MKSCVVILYSRDWLCAMSGFKAKDLTYDKSQPAFLQRLRAEYSGDRNNVQFARPNKSRLKTGEAEEDDPTIVDETGEGVSKEDYEEMLRREKEGDTSAPQADASDAAGRKSRVEARNHAQEGAREMQQVAAVGGGKKRKVGKIVGEGVDNVEATGPEDTRTEITRDDSKKATTVESTKPKKKAKKVKLSFDEPQD